MRVKLFVLTAVFVILVLGSGAASAQRPDGISYYVTVQASWGEEFEDCYIFGNDDTLTILGLPWPQRFDQKDHGDSKVFWQSVSVTGFPVFQIAFSGMATGNEFNGMIKGDAISDLGFTFTFKGHPADCGSYLSVEAEDSVSPYMGPQ